MKQIDNLSSESDQLIQINLEDGSLVSFEFVYKPAIQRWVFNVAFDTFEADNLNLCLHPNILREFRDKLPFGLACTSTDGADPAFIEDFSSARVAVYLLSAAEVLQVETAIDTGTI